MIAEPLRVLLRVTEILDTLAISYAVGGSVASGVHGEPRMTQDVDILVDLPASKVAPLVSALQPEFYVDLDTAQSAERDKSAFNAIHLGFHHKVDFFVAGETLLDREQLARRMPITIAAEQPAPVFVTSAENILLRKLDWFRQGNEVSDAQWRDILGLLKIGQGHLDLEYVRRIAAEVGLTTLLDRALTQAGA